MRVGKEVAKARPMRPRELTRAALTSTRTETPPTTGKTNSRGSSERARLSTFDDKTRRGHAPISTARTS